METYKIPSTFRQQPSFTLYRGRPVVIPAQYAFSGMSIISQEQRWERFPISEGLRYTGEIDFGELVTFICHGMGVFDFESSNMWKVICDFWLFLP